MKKICVLTSGGDSSGMNAYIKALSKLCKINGDKLFGAIAGFDGLIKNDFVELKYDELYSIENVGGTVIKTSRSKDFRTQEGFDLAVKNIRKNSFDCVVVVGGNGSFKGALALVKAGINIIAVPGTIDNDLFYTEKTLGFDTACQNAFAATEKIEQSMQSLERGVIVEVMGRNCPDIATFTALLSNADMLIASQMNFDEILQKISDIIKKGNQSPLVIVQENLIDVESLANFLSKNLEKEFKFSVLGYIQRGGKPVESDKLFAIQLAYNTYKKISESLYGYALGKKDGVMVASRLNDLNLESQKKQSDMQKLFESMSKI